jgi:hypothetical protein
MPEIKTIMFAIGLLIIVPSHISILLAMPSAVAWTTREWIYTFSIYPLPFFASIIGFIFLLPYLIYHLFDFRNWDKEKSCNVQFHPSL